jgi:hypothetical protein
MTIFDDKFAGTVKLFLTKRGYKPVIGSGFMIYFVTFALLYVWTNEPYTVPVDTRAKCRHLKKLTFKGTSRQLFTRIYTEIQSSL